MKRRKIVRDSYCNSTRSVGESGHYPLHIFMLVSIIIVLGMPTPPRSIGTELPTLSRQFSWCSSSSRSVFVIPNGYLIIGPYHLVTVNRCPQNKVSVRARFCFNLSLCAHWLRQKIIKIQLFSRMSWLALSNQINISGLPTSRVTILKLG